MKLFSKLELLELKKFINEQSKKYEYDFNFGKRSEYEANNKIKSLNNVYSVVSHQSNKWNENKF